MNSTQASKLFSSQQSHHLTKFLLASAKFRFFWLHKIYFEPYALCFPAGEKAKLPERGRSVLKETRPWPSFDCLLTPSNSRIVMKFFFYHIEEVCLGLFFTKTRSRAQLSSSLQYESTGGSVNVFVIFQHISLLDLYQKRAMFTSRHSTVVRDLVPEESESSWWNTWQKVLYDQSIKIQ